MYDIDCDLCSDCVDSDTSDTNKNWPISDGRGTKSYLYSKIYLRSYKEHLYLVSCGTKSVTSCPPWFIFVLSLSLQWNYESEPTFEAQGDFLESTVFVWTGNRICYIQRWKWITLYSYYNSITEAKYCLRKAEGTALQGSVGKLIKLNSRLPARRTDISQAFLYWRRLNFLRLMLFHALLPFADVSMTIQTHILVMTNE